MIADIPIIMTFFATNTIIKLMIWTINIVSTTIKEDRKNGLLRSLDTNVVKAKMFVIMAIIVPIIINGLSILTVFSFDGFL